MARDSSGTQNQPQYANTGVPSDAADLSEVSNYAALVGNRKTGPTTARNAASGADVWEGLIWGDTTDGNDYRYTSGGWSFIASPFSTPAINVTTGYGAGADMQVYKHNGFVYGVFHVARSSGQILSTDVLGTFPSGARPAQGVAGIIGLATANAAPMGFLIGTNGQVTVALIDSSPHTQARFNFMFRQGN